MISTFGRAIGQYNVAPKQSASGPRFRHKGQFMHSISTAYFQNNLLILSMHYNFTDLFQIFEIGDVHRSEFDDFVIDLNASSFGRWSRADKIHFHNGHVGWQFPFSGGRCWLRFDGTNVHLRPSRTETKEMALMTCRRIKLIEIHRLRDTYIFVDASWLTFASACTSLKPCSISFSNVFKSFCRQMIWLRACRTW